MKNEPELPAEKIAEAMKPLALSLERFQSNFKNIGAKLQVSFGEFDRALQNFRPIFAEVNQAVERLQAVARSEPIQRWQSWNRSELLPHEILSECLPPVFEIGDVKSKWSGIRNKLYSRFPSEMDVDSRKKRYNDILKCMTIGAYAPVCCATYAEIEAIFRDEVLFSNEEWRQELESKPSGNSRRSYVSNSFRDIINNDSNIFKFIDDDAYLFEVNLVSLYFFTEVKGLFDSFDPVDGVQHPRKSARHLHAHGWAKDTSFADALNALFIYDWALNILDERKKCNEQ